MPENRETNNLPIEEIGRIVVRAPNWLGDAVMSMPAVQRLRQRFPNAHLSLLTHQKLVGLWEHHPDINAVVPFGAAESILSLSGRLRISEFDVALILPNSPRSALEAWLARVPRRVGYGRGWRDWLLTDKVPARKEHVAMRKRSMREVNRLIEGRQARTGIPKAAHQMHDFLHLAAALGANPSPVAPDLRVDAEEAVETAKRFEVSLEGRGSARRLQFGLNAGAEYGPAKRWPVDRFIEAATELQRRTSCQWLLFGGKADVSLAGEIAQRMEAAGIKASENGCAPINLAGKTTLRELCALLKICNVVLTNDTGPMHVAAAIGTPVVVPFGSTSPELTGPDLAGSGAHQLLRSDAPCSPCFRRECPIDFRCMAGITVESVVSAVLRAVSAGGSKGL